MVDERMKMRQRLDELFERTRQQLPDDIDTGFFAMFIENSEYELAWRELSATSKGIAAGADFWNLMADTARLLGMGIEAREARNRANGDREITIMIPKAEGIILFEFLCRVDERRKDERSSDHSLDRRAERHTLAYLLDALENALVIPSSPDYLTLLHHGRDPLWPDYHALVERSRAEIEEEWHTE